MKYNVERNNYKKNQENNNKITIKRIRTIKEINDKG
jgi:hypothetical protein